MAHVLCGRRVVVLSDGIGLPQYCRLKPYLIPSSTIASSLWPVAIATHASTWRPEGRGSLEDMAFGSPVALTVSYMSAVCGYAVAS